MKKKKVNFELSPGVESAIESYRRSRRNSMRSSIKSAKSMGRSSVAFTFRDANALDEMAEVSEEDSEDGFKTKKRPNPFKI